VGSRERQVIEVIMIVLILVIFTYFMVRTYICGRLRGPLAKPAYYQHGEYDMKREMPLDRETINESTYDNE